MLRRVIIIAALPLLSAATHGSLLAQTQSTGSVRVSGDTLGGPAGCSSLAAITALQGWFQAVARGDTAMIVANVSPHFQWITADYRPRGEFFDGRQFDDLSRYVRRRSRVHERIAVRAIQFNGWRGQLLHFGPIEYEREADDLSVGPHSGIGKGAYECSGGLVVLSLGRMN
jgi:hypothetical protein